MAQTMRIHDGDSATLRQILRLLLPRSDRRVRLHLVAAVLLVVAGGAVSALTALALKSLVDALEASPLNRTSEPMMPLRWGIAYIALLCGGRALADLRPLMSGVVVQRIHAQLTTRFFDHLLHAPMAYLLKQRSGGLVHSLNLATTGAQLLIAHAVNSTLPVLVELFTMAAILIHLGQPVLVTTFGSTALIYFSIFALGSHRLKRQSRAVSEASLEVHAQLNEGIAHVETLRCFCAEPHAKRRLLHATQTLDTRWSQLTRLNMFIALAASATFTASMATSLLSASDAVARGALSVGGFVLANVYMLQMVRPLEVLGSAARDFARALGYLRPLLDILAKPNLAEQEEVKSSSTPHAPPSLARAPALRLENLHFAFEPGRPIFKGLDLDIQAGSTTAIVGRSGSGKSSLARLLMRLYAPDAGRILIDGQPIETLPLAQLRSSIGLVTQETDLLHTSISENIALGAPDASQEDIAWAARHARLEAFIDALPQGYSTQVGERGLQLSGGERQRVAIARVLLRRPALYVLDEPTSMLDGTTEAEILRSLHELTFDRTTVVIAHRLSTVMHADEIVVLDDGRIRERGSHLKLLARGGLYADMWRQQMRDAP